MQKLKNNKIVFILAFTGILTGIFSAGKEFEHYIIKKFN